MRKPWSRLPLRLLTLAFASSPGWVLGEPPARAFVLDSGRPRSWRSNCPRQTAGSVACRAIRRCCSRAPTDRAWSCSTRAGRGQERARLQGDRQVERDDRRFCSLAIVGRVELGSASSREPLPPQRRRLAVVCPGRGEEPGREPAAPSWSSSTSERERDRPLALEPGRPGRCKPRRRALALVRACRGRRSSRIRVARRNRRPRGSFDSRVARRGGWSPLRRTARSSTCSTRAGPTRTRRRTATARCRWSRSSAASRATLDAARSPASLAGRGRGQSSSRARGRPGGPRVGCGRCAAGARRHVKTAAKPKLVAAPVTLTSSARRRSRSSIPPRCR